MIYLITLNPAIDKYIYVKDFKLGITNISFDKYDIFGGKAINVGKIVNEYINDYEIITTICEEHEDFILKETKGLNFKFFKAHSIRENLKINDNSNITEINESTNTIGENLKEEIGNYLLKKVTKEDYVLFAGSVHKDDVSFIKDICQNIKSNKIIIDSASFTLEDIKKIKPYMVKPNDEELEKLFGQNTTVKEGVDKLLDLGVQKVVVSLGKDGSYYKDKENEYNILGIKGNVINTVGAGDSYVGGFLVGNYLNKSTEEIVRLASACASATVFNETIGKKEQINQLMSCIKIRNI